MNWLSQTVPPVSSLWSTLSQGLHGLQQNCGLWSNLMVDPHDSIRPAAGEGETDVHGISPNPSSLLNLKMERFAGQLLPKARALQGCQIGTLTVIIYFHLLLFSCVTDDI